MTRIWDERFEASGYDETWNDGEYVDAGCTLDEDATPPSGAPAAWGSQCLRSVNTSSNDEAEVEHTFSTALGEFYWRMEFYVAAEGLADGQEQKIAALFDPAYNTYYEFGLRQTSGQLYLYYYEDYDETDVAEAISTGTFYRVEFGFDGSSGAHEVRLDGSTFFSDTLSGGYPTTIGIMEMGLGWQARACDVYFDLVAIDDANWVGAEDEAVGFFDGRIDEVGIWGRALTNSEVEHLYNAGTGVSYGDLT